MADTRSCKRLTAQKKFQIFLETRPAEAPTGEILRRNGLSVEDLRRIEETVEAVSTEALKMRSGHWKRMEVSPEQYETLRRRHEALQKAHGELAVEMELLKKVEALEQQNGISRRGNGRFITR
jgi:hypothetical protein